MNLAKASQDCSLLILLNASGCEERSTFSYGGRFQPADFQVLSQTVVIQIDFESPGRPTEFTLTDADAVQSLKELLQSSAHEIWPADVPRGYGGSQAVIRLIGKDTLLLESINVFIEKGYLISTGRRYLALSESISRILRDAKKLGEETEEGTGGETRSAVVSSTRPTR